MIYVRLVTFLYIPEGGDRGAYDVIPVTASQGPSH